MDRFRANKLQRQEEAHRAQLAADQEAEDNAVAADKLPNEENTAKNEEAENARMKREEAENARKKLTDCLKVCLRDMLEPTTQRQIFSEKNLPEYKNTDTSAQVWEKVIQDLWALWLAVHLSLRSSLAFRRMDYNSDDSIAREEFEKALVSLGMPLEDSEALFRSMDSDGNEKISM